MTYLEAWMETAGALFSQALAGGPELVESPPQKVEGDAPGFVVEIGGELEGSFTVVLDPGLVMAALLGEDTEQKAAWAELLKEAAEATSGELLARTGVKCRVERFAETAATSPVTHSFQLKSGAQAWQILVRDDVKTKTGEKRFPAEAGAGIPEPARVPDGSRTAQGLDLLLDVELDATIRFGCRELPLREILELGPGDVVTLDRQIADPADLIVGDKIVARGEVVLVNGNFGLKVTEVAAPRKRLESIRCLF